MLAFYAFKTIDIWNLYISYTSHQREPKLDLFPNPNQVVLMPTPNQNSSTGFVALHRTSCMEPL